MKQAILLVMAAGLGSRYGGMKQIDPVGEHGQLIIDYSIYDAKKAGFNRVVFIITKAMEESFRQAIGDRISQIMEVHYAYQDINDLPDGSTVPPERKKPWGTAQAVLAARNIIDAPFAVINADDYYGTEGFRDIYQHLIQPATTPPSYAMVGFSLKNTVTPYGHVARGICTVDENSKLCSIQERTRIEQKGDLIQHSVDNGASWETLPEDTLVSMNLWGLQAGFMEEAEKFFAEFLKNTENLDSAECYLPAVVDKLVAEKKVEVTVLTSQDRWYGVTYQEDKPFVVKAIAEKTAEGLYPSKLWEE